MTDEEIQTIVCLDCGLPLGGDAMNGWSSHSKKTCIDSIIAKCNSLKAQVALLEKADNVFDVTVDLDEGLKAEVLALRSALRDLLPYVDTSKVGAFRAVGAADQVLDSN